MAKIVQFLRHRWHFGSIQEAMMALSMDKLGSVYVKGGKVFIVTTFGSGEFDKVSYDNVVRK